ncbi:MAG: hypothetical protein WC905_04910 [Patescibacteria group bacterium]|jgi:hypothetical protein
MKNLLTSHYWFNLRPEALTPPVQKIFIGFLLLLVIAAIIAAVTRNRGGIYRGWLKRAYSFCASNTVIGLFLLFFNYEFVPFLSARFWLGLWALIMLIWLISLLKSLKNIPRIKKQVATEKELKKYLP